MLRRHVEIIVSVTNDWRFTGGCTRDGTINFSALSSRGDVQLPGIFIQAMEGPESPAH